jgi:hypothetical protein
MIAFRTELDDVVYEPQRIEADGFEEELKSSEGEW